MLDDKINQFKNKIPLENQNLIKPNKLKAR